MGKAPALESGDPTMWNHNAASYKLCDISRQLNLSEIPFLLH